MLPERGYIMRFNFNNVYHKIDGVSIVIYVVKQIKKYFSK